MKNFKKIFLIAIGVVIIIVVLLPYVLSVETDELDGNIRSKTPGKYVQLSKGWTHYEISGPEKGKTVLLVHGFSCPYFIWDSTVTSLTKAGFRVIRFDLWGRGTSDRPDVTYDISLFKSQIEELLKKLNINKPFDIVGLSMGGAVSAAFVGDNPNLIRKVVLLDPFSEKAKLFPINIPIVGSYIVSTVIIPSSPNKQSFDVQNPDKIPSDWKEKIRAQMKFKGFTRAIFSTLINTIGQDPRPYFEKMGKQKKQSLVFWGEKDKTTPAGTGIYLKKVLNCDYRLVANAGHLVHVDAPDLVYSEIIKFLSK